MEHLIKELTILLLVSLPINIFFHRVKVPSVMGYLIAGILIGPFGLTLIGDTESIRELAEIGVILLLFVIGMEFPLRHLLKNIISVIEAGGIQLFLTAGLVGAAMFGLGYDWMLAGVAGLLTALSSTAVVIIMITDSGESETRHGQLCIGILLFQDLAVVPMMLMIPLLAKNEGVAGLTFFLAFVKAAGAVISIFLLSRLVVPRTLAMVAQAGNKEHLTLLVILIVLGTGWISKTLGLSLAMGAFIAGMIISESEFSHQIILDILPLRDYFTSIFFISMGMLLDLNIFMESPWLYLGLALAVVLTKGAVVFAAVQWVNRSFRDAFISAFRLAQVGEFSLLLAGMALEWGLFPLFEYQGFLIISLITILIAPLLLQVSSPLSIKIYSALKPGRLFEPEEKPRDDLENHVIVAGYGLNGRNLSRVLLETKIPFIILDAKGECIKEASDKKINTLFGDCTHSETLIQAGIMRARMVVFAISDPVATGQAVRVARRLNPDVHILVRTRYASQVETLMNEGANQVIPEEFETSVEIFSRVLREYRIPNNVIEQQVELIRMEGYSMFRGLSLNVESLRKFSTYLTATLTDSFHVEEDSWIRNQTRGSVKVNLKTGARLIALVRNQELITEPDRDFKFMQGDILIVFGRHAQVDKTMRLFKNGPEPENPEEKGGPEFREENAV